MAVRIALIPVVAGLSYEIIRLSAKKEGGLVFKLITRPGVWLQNITTKEPDDSQLEVALVALKESLKLEPQTGEASVAPLSRRVRSKELCWKNSNRLKRATNR